MTREEEKLQEAASGQAPWRLWGPYLSERQWGTVREDYSVDGDAWAFFSHDHARSRAYRWGEDGLAGICDEGCRLCFAIALWNGSDPFLKERLFGLGNPEGNHGEDVKECYFYLDNVPSHSYLKFAYKYPHRPFPYADLLAENGRRKADLSLPEYELLDTGIFEEGRYTDVLVEYAKNDPKDILVRIELINRSPASARVCLLPTLWFRNTWSWTPQARKPRLRERGSGSQRPFWQADHPELDPMALYFSSPAETLFVENETNFERFGWGPNRSPYPKDGIHDYLIHGKKTVNPEKRGTKAAAYYPLFLEAGESRILRLRLSADLSLGDRWEEGFEAGFQRERDNADQFYRSIAAPGMGEEERQIQRQAFAGLLWNKQFYHYVVERWLEGDPGFPTPPLSRYRLPNARWTHFYGEEILLMPDKWEFPWFASWDSCFQALVLALIDPQCAKEQLLHLAREWYMHPSGQIPACEWSFSDVNPPLHAWAAWRIFEIERRSKGKGDLTFLGNIFHRCLFSFSWWLNREDAEGNNLFQGGFLGLDNIGLLDRSALPEGVGMFQVDASAWMGLFAVNMIEIATELAETDAKFQDIAAEFFIHFARIARALNEVPSLPQRVRERLWDPQDHFYYDVLRLPSGEYVPLKARSLQGVMPIFAVGSVPRSLFWNRRGRLRERIGWFLRSHPEFLEQIGFPHEELAPGIPRSDPSASQKDLLLLSLVSKEKLRALLSRLLDEKEFLSPYGIRSVSKHHEDHPLVLTLDGKEYRLAYAPGEATTRRLGGNSNWRGPIWFPINFLLIESLQKYHYYYGDEFRVECPTGSGRLLNLWEVSQEISRRLVSLFTRDEAGRRPVFRNAALFDENPAWREFCLFFEYFHGDTGAGLGASHQTGWTALVAKLIQQLAEYRAPAA
ncbi:MAG: glucosidase [Candidatus Methylacidiphilaceae bacterium]